MTRQVLGKLRLLLSGKAGDQYTDERNVALLYIELAFASLLTVAASFNGAYVLRLGGSNTLVGLLSSIPALIAAIVYMPSARILERKTKLMPWLLGSLTLARIGYLVIAILPFFTQKFLPEVTVAILVIMTAFSAFFSTAWNPMFSEIIPVRSRSTVISWRAIISSLTIAPLVFLAGRWLVSIRFPLNYQILYLFGLAGGIISIYLVSQLRIPARKVSQTKSQEHQTGTLRDLAGMMRHNPMFLRITINTFLLSFGAWMISPLYIILYVKQLGASDGWLGMLNTLAYIGVIVGYWLWRRVIRRIGESRTLLIALPLVIIFPFLVALVPNLTFILFAAFFVNAVSPGVDLSHSVIWFGLLPPEQKYTATALYSAVMNVGAFIAPLIGVAIANAIGIIPTLLIGGTLRVIGAATFYLLPVRPAREEPIPTPVNEA
ncbi:MAG: MFS transporter [Chloroflexi bacterium]|nr:MFS transporter [Chloroflexota bacterium]